MENKKESKNSATCMACGWGEGGEQRKGQMWRAGAKKGEKGGQKKGRMRSAGPKKERMRPARRRESMAVH